MIRGILIAITAVSLAACTPMTNNPGARETVTITRAVPGAPAAGTETSKAAPAPPGVYAGAGVFSVGNSPSGGAQRSIPPGRYTVTVTPGQQMGTWLRCSNVVGCTVGGPSEVDIENAMGQDYSSVMEIRPTDAAIWLDDVTLTRVP